MKRFDLSQVADNDTLLQFAAYVLAIDRTVDFKISARGWAYMLEQKGLVTKDEFDRVEKLINACRKRGMLPVDFVADDSSRDFKEVHDPTKETYEDYVASWLKTALRCPEWYDPNWWEGETYYIQMIVEKVDLVSLFRPICKDYHIPIANSKGWSSILQRAEYCKRFKQAEDKGLQPVLMYCGDHDPDGLRISDTIRKNLEQVSDIYWSDGTDGYDPRDLIIDRFGLNYDFIIDTGLTWIDNLVTGAGNILAYLDDEGTIQPGVIKKGKRAGQPHQNYFMPYMQEYLRKVGVRKCEANALVIDAEAGREMCEEAIQKYLGPDAKDRFEEKKQVVESEITELMDDYGAIDAINKLLKSIQ